MGETAEYQRLQETSECDYQRLPSDDEEVLSFINSSGHDKRAEDKQHYFRRRCCASVKLKGVK